MFVGTYEYVIDEKFRALVPSSFRQALEAEEGRKGFFISQGIEPCLCLYVPSKWNEIVGTRFAKLASAGEKARTFARMVGPNAGFAALDNQGRIVIPENLRGGAGITPKCRIVFLGVFDRIEIWRLDTWQKWDEVNRPRFTALAEEFFSASELGIPHGSPAS